MKRFEQSDVRLLDEVRGCVRRMEVPEGPTDRRSWPDEEKTRMKALEREVKELRTANEILKKASAYFAPPLPHASMCCRAAGRSSTARSGNARFHQRLTGASGDDLPHLIGPV